LLTMNRIDPELIELKKLLDNTTDKEQKTIVEKKILNRQNLLLPIYHQIAIKFAELHDTSGRMYTKKCVSEVVSWKNSRSFFYLRLKRRVSEHRIANKIMTCYKKGQSTYSEAINLLHLWYQEDTKEINIEDSPLISWLSKESTNTLIQNKINELKMMQSQSYAHEESYGPNGSYYHDERSGPNGSYFHEEQSSRMSAPAPVAQSSQTFVSERTFAAPAPVAHSFVTERTFAAPVPVAHSFLSMPVQVPVVQAIPTSVIRTAAFPIATSVTRTMW